MDDFVSVRCQQWVNGRQCLAPAYETLRDLCMDHYRELIVRPTWIKFCNIEQEWHQIEHELYRVEVALGMRGRILALTISPSEGKVQREIDEFHADPPKRLKRQRQRELRSPTLIDDEDINNDI